MKPESKFVYDWLKAHIDLLGLTVIRFAAYSSTFTPGTPPYTGYLWDREETQVTFACRGKYLHLTDTLKLEVPKLILEKHIYRALYELKSDSVNTFVTEDEIAKCLGKKNVIDLLKEQT